MKDSIVAECRKAALAFQELETVAEAIEAACVVCIRAIQQGRTLYFCGNGGSAADAQHFAAELVGRYHKERLAFRAVALTVDSSVLTSVGNDYGFKEVFSRQVEGFVKEGDVSIFGEVLSRAYVHAAEYLPAVCGYDLASAQSAGFGHPGRAAFQSTEAYERIDLFGQPDGISGLA